MLSELYGEIDSSDIRHNVAVVLLARAMAKVIINIDEEFPTLRHAPSVEAVIDIRVSPANPPNEESLRGYIQSKFIDYQFLDSQNEFQVQFEVGQVINKPPNQTVGRKGLRFKSKDQPYIAQFNRDGFVLSRLKPYQSWFQLQTEAMRLLIGYAEFVKPLQIFRIGLRYINQIQMPADELKFEDYLEVAPSTPNGLGLPIAGFLHQDNVVVPEYPYYAVNIIKTLQPPNPSTKTNYALILDIDVVTTQPFDYDETRLENHLAEMRWLKNKVFFGVIKEKSLEMFR